MLNRKAIDMMLVEGSFISSEMKFSSAINREMLDDIFDVNRDGISDKNESNNIITNA